MDSSNKQEFDIDAFLIGSLSIPLPELTARQRLLVVNSAVDRVKHLLKYSNGFKPLADFFNGEIYPGVLTKTASALVALPEGLSYQTKVTELKVSYSGSGRMPSLNLGVLYVEESFLLLDVNAGFWLWTAKYRREPNRVKAWSTKGIKVIQRATEVKLEPLTAPKLLKLFEDASVVRDFLKMLHIALYIDVQVRRERLASFEKALAELEAIKGRVAIS